jgi:H+/Cl- antiporter ClcA
MTSQTLRLVRNIVLRSFAIGAAIAVLQVIATLVFWNFWISVASAWWHTDEAHLSSLALNYYTQLRFFLVFVLLVPGLAIHWTVKDELRRSA